MKSLELIENGLKGKNLTQHGHLLLVRGNESLNLGGEDLVDEDNELGFWTTEKKKQQTNQKRIMSITQKT